MRISLDKLDKRELNPRGSSETPSDQNIKPKKYSGAESVAMSMEKDVESKKTMSVDPSQSVVNKGVNKNKVKDAAKENKDKGKEAEKDKGKSNTNNPK